ncbi:hypothetical protein BJ875DRAFT_521712 [Amylocarpus encephaloides]|uniref:Uncharacterized protein n=1 Tax=Amylocarpus encephaloides TaxID=45428 RepID=A0A9P7YAS2_9HELO|nr:hypothetical protein BJ875DRAFT_521712 [Amylocarpus encephaloides]
MALITKDVKDVKDAYTRPVTLSPTADGSLNFIGRKDAQTKINGQRLELGDVEHNLVACINADPSEKVAAEGLTPRDSDKPMLVAFVQSSQHVDVRRKMIGLQDRLDAPGGVRITFRPPN